MAMKYVVTPAGRKPIEEGVKLLGPAATAYDVGTSYAAGEDPERIAMRTGLGIAGGAAGGALGAAGGTAAAPGPGTAVGGFAGYVGGSTLGDYAGGALYDAGIRPSSAIKTFKSWMGSDETPAPSKSNSLGVPGRVGRAVAAGREIAQKPITKPMAPSTSNLNPIMRQGSNIGPGTFGTRTNIFKT